MSGLHIIIYLSLNNYLKTTKMLSSIFLFTCMQWKSLPFHIIRKDLNWKNIPNKHFQFHCFKNASISPDINILFQNLSNTFLIKSIYHRIYSRNLCKNCLWNNPLVYPLNFLDANFATFVHILWYPTNQYNHKWWMSLP